MPDAIEFGSDIAALLSRHSSEHVTLLMHQPGLVWYPSLDDKQAYHCHSRTGFAD
jgi:hypothetical protein